MLNPLAVIIVLSILCVLLLLVIPLLDAVPKLTKYISLRWVCVALVLILMTGVVIDCSHLADSSRNYLILGGLIITGLFIVARTLEKVLCNGWLKGVNVQTQVQKGDITLSANISTDQDVKLTPYNTQNTEENK